MALKSKPSSTQEGLKGHLEMGYSGFAAMMRCDD
jgi:hypothetical protein